MHPTSTDPRAGSIITSMTLFSPKLLSFLIIIFGLFLVTTPPPLFAQEGTPEEILEGTIQSISDYGQETFMDQLVPYQNLQVLITKGSLKDQIITVKNSAATGDVTLINYQEFRPQDRIKIYHSINFQGEPYFVINGKIKRDGLITLVIIFSLCVLLVGRLWGALSLIGMAISFLVIFKLIVPLIIGGTNPVMAVVLGSFLIIPSTFYISHGVNIKTHVGVIATVIALVFTGCCPPHRFRLRRSRFSPGRKTRQYRHSRPPHSWYHHRHSRHLRRRHRRPSFRSSTN